MPLPISKHTLLRGIRCFNLRPGEVLLDFLQLLHTHDAMLSYIGHGRFLDIFSNNSAAGHFVTKIISSLIK